MTTTFDLTYDLSSLYSVWPAAANGGEAIGFADLDDLVLFLLRVLASKAEDTQGEA